jgi:hypothetical protein
MSIIGPIIRPVIAPTIDPLASGALPWEAGGGVAPVAWTPADLANLEAWWRLDDVITSGTAITTITDKSASGHNLTQGTASARMTATTRAGQAAGSCDGGDREAVSFGHSHAQPLTVYLVAEFANLSGNYYLFDGAGAGARCALSIAAAGPTWSINGGSVVSGGTPAEDEIFLACVVFNGASSALYVGDMRTGQEVITGNAGAHSPDGFTLGARHDGAGALQGFVWEAIMSHAADDAASRALVATYAAARYDGLAVTT